MSMLEYEMWRDDEMWDMRWDEMIESAPSEGELLWDVWWDLCSHICHLMDNGISFNLIPSHLLSTHLIASQSSCISCHLITTQSSPPSLGGREKKSPLLSSHRLRYRHLIYSHRMSSVVISTHHISKQLHLLSSHLQLKAALLLWGGEKNSP